MNIAPLFSALIFYVTARYLAMKLLSSTVKEKAESVYPLASLLSTVVCPLYKVTHTHIHTRLKTLDYTSSSVLLLSSRRFTALLPLLAT